MTDETPRDKDSLKHEQIMQLCIELGLRASEIQNIQLDDLNEDNDNDE